MLAQGKGFLPTPTASLIITAYTSFTIFPDLSSGRKVAGKKLYEFFHAVGICSSFCGDSEKSLCRTLIPHAVLSIQTCVASLSLPRSTTLTVSLKMDCKRRVQAGQKCWRAYYIITEMDIIHYCRYSTLLSLHALLFRFKTLAQFSENKTYYAEICWSE